jgi:hypothetical protein
MDKETSDRVSSIAAALMDELRKNPTQTQFTISRDHLGAIAGSALSQDTTRGPGNGPDAASAEFSPEQIAADPILHFFHYSHLPPMLQKTSKAFFLLAHHVVETVPRSPERTVALRKLLEGKDAAVRANLPAPKKPVVASERTPELGEVVEKGTHDRDRDGDPPFRS